MTAKLDLTGLTAFRDEMETAFASKWHSHPEYVKASDVADLVTATTDEIKALFDSNYGTVTITQKENETITVTCNGNDYTTTFKELLGYPWTASVVADSGYVAGDLSSSSGKVVASVEITVGDATENA